MAAEEDFSSDYSEDFEEEEEESSGTVPSAKPSAVEAREQKARKETGPGRDTAATVGEGTPNRRQPTVQMKPPTIGKSTGARRRGFPATKQYPNANTFTPRRLQLPHHSKGSPVRDRQISAKNHTIHSLQNKLSEASKQLEEVRKENKLLNRLQVRQERELNKIQKQEDELPQILHRHTEEVKAARKRLRKSQEEVAAGKHKAEELLKEIRRLSESNRNLEKLVKSKKLLERDQLTVQLDQTRQRLQEKEKRVTELERGLEATSKNHSQEMRVLMQRNRALATETQTLRETTTRFQQELKEKSKEMDILNIYTQRIPRSLAKLQPTKSPSHPHPPPVQPPLVASQGSQTTLSCPPLKLVSLKHRSQLKTVSSQTDLDRADPKTVHQVTTSTQTGNEAKSSAVVEEAERKSPAQNAASDIHTHSPPPASQSPRPQPLEATAEGVQMEPSKQLLIQKLRQLDSQKAAPGSDLILPTRNTAPDTTGGMVTTAQTRPQQPTLPTASGTEPKPPPAVQPEVAASEQQKKQLLLAKLMAIDEGGDPNHLAAAQQGTAKQAGAPSSATRSNASISSKPDVVENLHQGKPAYATEDDPFGSRTRLTSTRRSLGRGGSSVRGGMGAREEGEHNVPKGAEQTFMTEQKETSSRTVFGRQGPVAASGADKQSQAQGEGNRHKPLFGRRAADPVTFGSQSRSNGKSNPFSLPSDIKNTVQSNMHTSPWQPLAEAKQPPSQTIFGESASLSSRGALLPLRPKAEPAAMRSNDVMPGATVSEPDDLEELVL